MNPWATADGGGASLGGIKAFVARHRLNDTTGLCLDRQEYSSVRLTDQIDKLMQLKTTALERVRELEQLEMQLTTGGILLPRQLEAKVEAVQSLRSDLEELLAMKSVLLRTLQKNVASEYLDLEMTQQRTFIDLFLKLSDELPRYATSAVGSSASGPNHSLMAHDIRQRHKDYEAAVAQCKATIAKFHLIRDDTARVRAAYSQLYQSTVDAPAFAG